jgi:quercetin dioxygenase-like cupin family protein
MIRRMDVRRTFVVPVVAVLLLGSGYLSTAGSARIAVTRPAIQQDGSLALPNCSPAESGEQVQPMPAVAPSLAPPDAFGAVDDLLATAFVAEVPPGPLRLVLRRIELETGQGADPRTSQGPLLYYVQSGTVTFHVEGTEQVRSEHDCLFVPAEAEISYQNDANPPTRAVVLRLSLAPPRTEDQEIAIFIEPTTTSGMTPAASSLLLSADVASPPQEGAWLFLTAIAWNSPVADPGWHRHSGPVGLHVETGGVTVDLLSGQRRLPQQGCAYIPADTIHRELAAEVPTTILLAGVLPAAGALWISDEPPGPEDRVPTLVPSEVRCSE